jgi:dTDP-4-dehydrorhamnose reductase
VTWLVTGARGMLGHDLVARLAGGAGVTALGREDLDVTDPEAVGDAVHGHDVVVNCAAWTDVDGAETREPEATRVNADGPRLLAAACREAGARLVHLSTDYVFSGQATTPYDEDARTDPRSAYGRSKRAGEQAVREELPGGHLIVRTAWLYGAQGPCFPKTIVRVARERGALRVVDDQVGQPTWTRDVADLVVRLVEADAPPGTYHATSSGQTSWWGFAGEVVEAAGLDPGIVAPTTTEEFPRPAPRPAYSVLGHRRLAEIGLRPIGPWAERWAAAAGEVLAGTGVRPGTQSSSASSDSP